jgi:hypothetical protein
VPLDPTTQIVAVVRVSFPDFQSVKVKPARIGAVREIDWPGSTPPTRVFVKPLLSALVVPLVPEAVQVVLPLKNLHEIVAEEGPESLTPTLPSVNVTVATPPADPVAVAL